MSGSSQTGSRSLESGDPQWRRWRAAAVRWVVAIVSVASAVILAQVLEHHWQSTPFVSLFLCAIMVSAWFGGLKPGLLAIALSVLAFDYYFLLPTHSLVPNLNELPRLVLFAIAALMVGLLSAAQKSATESLRLARDDLAAKVQELNSANEALHAENAERKRAEAALQKAQAELAHITRMTTMGELTASIAHEVNQPLTAVLNNANACLDLLPKGAPHLAEVRDALTEIIDDADRASAVIARVRQPRSLLSRSGQRRVSKSCDFHSTRCRYSVTKGLNNRPPTVASVLRTSSLTPITEHFLESDRTQARDWHSASDKGAYEKAIIRHPLAATRRCQGCRYRQPSRDCSRPELVSGDGHRNTASVLPGAHAAIKGGRVRFLLQAASFQLSQSNRSSKAAVPIRSLRPRRLRIRLLAVRPGRYHRQCEHSKLCLLAIQR